MRQLLERPSPPAPAPAEDPGPPAAPPRATSRLRGLDGFRGLVLAVMVLTPVTGTDGSYPHLGHAAWNGLTVADVVLPSFLVASGASLALLLRPPVTSATVLRLVRRLVALVALGVLYNAIGASLDLGTLRLTGVLQTIGISGTLAAAVLLGCDRIRRWPAAGTAVPIIIAAVGTTLHGRLLERGSAYCARPFAEPVGCSPLLHLDLDLLGAGHLYRGGTTYDPEGVAATIAATALVLLGAATMRGVLLLRDRGTWRWLWPLLLGAVLLAAGLAAADVQPVNKRLHSPAFVLTTGGGAVAALGVMLVLLDTHLLMRGLRRIVEAFRSAIAWPLVTLGRNALVVYLGEHVLLTALDATRGPDGSPTLLHHLAFETFGFAGHRAHLLTTATVLAILLAATAVMRLLRWRIVL